MASAKRYRVNEQKLAEQKKLGPQAELIVKAMLDSGTGLTVKEVADFIKDKLQTRQDPVRVVNFYMSTWKKKGLVEVSGEIPVFDKDLSSGPPAGDIVDEQGQQRPHVDTPPFDYGAATLKSAVAQAIKQYGGGTAMDIHHNLQVAGRSAKVKQVADTVSKLLKDGVLIRDAEGRISMPEQAHA